MSNIRRIHSYSDINVQFRTCSTIVECSNVASVRRANMQHGGRWSEAKKIETLITLHIAPHFHLIALAYYQNHIKIAVSTAVFVVSVKQVTLNLPLVFKPFIY